MDSLWPSIHNFLKVLGSYIVAVCRLVLWTAMFFLVGLQRTLFMRSEVVGFELGVTPLRCDIADTDEKLAYIDKLCMENPDLVESIGEEFGGDSGEWLDDDEDNDDK